MNNVQEKGEEMDFVEEMIEERERSAPGFRAQVEAEIARRDAEEKGRHATG